MDATFEQARQFFMQGLAHFEAGRFEQAQAQFEASLSLVPQRASTLTNLGATRLRLGKFADAAIVLEEATQVDPGDAQAWGHLATARAELGKHDDALRCADEALARDVNLGPVWTLKGTLLREMRRNDEARACFARALETGGDPHLNAYYLAALGGGDAPQRPPRHYVAQLFDTYAADFDQHAKSVLNYRAPAILAQGLGARNFGTVLDLGCGTGLMAQALQGRAQSIVGVDLSAAMVARARDRGAYARVVQADVVEFVATCEERFDLVTAADVFIYVGELDEVFGGVHRVLNDGGVMAFTAELAPPDASVALQPSLRYAHSRGYLESLASKHGFEVMAIEQHAIRDDQRAPVAGLYCWLRRR